MTRTTLLDRDYVFTDRGGIIENTHGVHIAVTDIEGNILFSAGNPSRVTHSRSAAKPAQAVAVIETGAVDKFGFDEIDLALTCASHSSEDFHIARAKNMLSKIKAGEDGLRCGGHPAVSEEVNREWIKTGFVPTGICNNCSGKHVAMMAGAEALGANVKDYHLPSHPMQLEVKRVVGDLAHDPKQVEWGVDGCNLPAPAYPLFYLAQKYHERSNRASKVAHLDMMSIFFFLLAALAWTTSAASPKATTLNGTYVGKNLPDWDQDAFLGIPYAQPPVGNLRFKWPQSLDSSFTEERTATEYGDSCMQYTQNWTMSEDCLSLNVIRPAGKPKKLLPVLVWIYGGGLYAGSSADPQYNLSGIVKVSQDIKEPILAVSFNYRLGMWGFLQNFSLLKEGNANAGLLDQRLALRWIQENIEAFGGDPERVVVWGESAGAQSIAYQMLSYDGRDDGLYRGAILESGGITGAQIHDLSYYNVAFENLTRTVGCWDKKDQLACLRDLDEKSLYAARPSLTFNPLIDGTFLTGYPSQLIREKNYHTVPLIIGANTDEGFCIGKVNTDQDLFYEAFRWRNYALSAPTIRKLMELYPDDPCHQPPYAITDCSRQDGNYQGRRACAIGADITMISGRRKLAELYAQSEDVYSYRFDQRPYLRSEWDGVKHFDNVAFSFQNISGLLGPSPQYDSHAVLANTIGQAYVRFVNSLDPNSKKGKLPKWPKYSKSKPKNMVFNATKNWVEDDTWRKQGIDYINSYEVARELYG
ncbi:hypothetical protein FPRO05_01643 [Fusarium proliferatum]|uniref:Carboxylesterase type B domain-containing protein n=1 Tax=Gibberella intermedia TaxID=948311 RepID=A0A365N7Y7_GIBIN|nr:hypothetical protein FPRO05_01643 [Fusarium proliferatum]